MKPHIAQTIEELRMKRVHLDLIITSLENYGRETAGEVLHVEQPAPAEPDRGCPSRSRLDDTKPARRGRPPRVATTRAPREPAEAGTPNRRKSPAGAVITQIRDWCALQPGQFKVLDLAKALTLERKTANDRLCQLVIQGFVRRVARGVFTRSDTLAREARRDAQHAQPGAFVPRPTSSHLEKAVTDALGRLRSPWRRDELEAALSEADRLAGRHDGALAAVLVNLRERGQIERLGGHGEEATYRTAKKAG